MIIPKNHNLILMLIYLIITTISIFLLFISIENYPGNKFIYLFYSLIINLYLFYSFFKSNYFFDFFLSIFVYFGFGFKLAASLIFTNENFEYKLSNIFTSKKGLLINVSDNLLSKSNCQITEIKCDEYSNIINNGLLYDKGLMISCLSIFAFFLSSQLINYFDRKFNISKNNKNLESNEFYEKKRKYILIIYPIIILVICLFNFKFSIFQRGIVYNGQVPWIRPLFAWLLLFGLTAFSTLLIFFELKRKNNNIKIVLFLSILEPFFSSLSSISRGSIFNSSALIAPLVKKLNKLNIFYLISLISFSSLLFVTSLYVIFDIRHDRFITIDTKTNITKSELKNLREEIHKPSVILNSYGNLLINRWVGISEIILVANSNKTGINFFKQSFLEKQSDNTISYYDKAIINNYLDTNFQKFNHTSVPGLISFLYFSNNLLIVFFGCFLFSLICLILELISYKLSSQNYFFSSLIGHILAFRLIHFGVYPIETYKILFAIFLTIFISYITSKFFLKTKINIKC